MITAFRVAAARARSRAITRATAGANPGIALERQQSHRDGPELCRPGAASGSPGRRSAGRVGSPRVGGGRRPGRRGTIAVAAVHRAGTGAALSASARTRLPGRQARRFLIPERIPPHPGESPRAEPPRKESRLTTVSFRPADTFQRHLTATLRGATTLRRDRCSPAIDPRHTTRAV
jgi:hypothetical protein